MTNALGALMGNTPARLADATLPPRVRSALDALLKDARHELARQLPKVLQDTELALLRAEPKGDTRLEAANHASMRSLHDGERVFSERFMADIEASLAGIQRQRTLAADGEPEPVVLTLSLLEDDVVSDEALLENMASRIESRNSLSLQLMGQRFGVLAGAPAFEGDSLPLGPHALTRALDQAATALNLSRYARVQLFRQFEQAVMGAYAEILDGFNNRLSEAGVLPHLRFVPARPRQAGSAADAGKPAAPASETAGAGAREHTQTQGNQAPAISGAAAHGAIGPVATHTPGQPVATLATGGTGGTRFAALQNLLKRRRLLLAKLRPGGVDERAREPLQRNEVLGALQRMRTTSNPSESLADYRQTLLAQARQMHGHGMVLSDPDNDAFELLTLFLTQLQRDLRKSSPGDTLVARLRLPLLQLALSDQAFFVDAGHPARQLLNAASLAGARWLGDDDLDPQWLGLLQRAIARVQQDSESARDTFTEANQTLQSGLQGLARKTEMAERRQVEAARGREKLLLARQRATAEIDRMLAGRSLPRFHRILVDQAWADVLSLTVLRNGEQSEAWQELLQASAKLLDAATHEAPGNIDMTLLDYACGALEQVGYHADDAKAIVSQLVNQDMDATDLASRTELLVQLRARARLGEGSEAGTGQHDTPRNPEEQAAFDRLRLLEEPVWIELDDAEGNTVRRRLAWVSARTGQTLLVNRRGQRIPASDLDALARQLAAGRLRILSEDIAPAEAAWESTTNSLHRIAESGNLQEMEPTHGS